MIPAGAHVGMSGFTGRVPQGGSAGPGAAHPAAQTRRASPSDRAVDGCFHCPELDGALAQVDGIDMRRALPVRPHLPQADQCRANAVCGHPPVARGPVRVVLALGKLDVAVVEVAGCCPTAPDSVPSVGNNKTWLDQADKIILK